MKRALIIPAAILLACGGADTALLVDGMEDAGEAMADAGEALQDAAEWLDSGAQAQEDAGTDSAVPQPPAGPEVLESPCDLTRVRSGSGTTGTEKWAKVTVAIERIRSVWACQPAKPQACAGSSMCSGAEIPAAECSPPIFHYAQGAVWALCGDHAKVRVVASTP